MSFSFLSTAIPYVNARPHVGFAYELVLADIVARHRRRRGRVVRLVTGTDDHSLKNVRAAALEGLSVRALVDRNAAAFRELGGLLDVAPDEFVRTSDDPRHPPAVAGLWRACAADLDRRRWQGLYCVGCEAVVDGPCDEHAAPPEPFVEDNWFFRLSRHAPAVRAAIEDGRLAITPDAARAETLAFLAGDVRDLSVSRAAARAGGWGLPVPDDPSQVIYVWFDALAYYLTAGWRDATERVQVLGKGISRFHAVYWPAFLLAAGLPLPDRLLVHGYLTIDGEKISKSGRTLEGPPLVAKVGVDALRWYFARRLRTSADGDVSEAAIIAAHDTDLAGGLGNLVQRAVALASRASGGRIPPRPPETPDDAALRAHAEALPAAIDRAIDAFLPDDAAAAIVALVDAANRHLDARAPWRSIRAGDLPAAAAAVHPVLEAARIAAAELAPIAPRASALLIDRLGGAAESSWGHLPAGVELRPGAPPFPRLRER
jgi:methionyl-tRNA synthetase